MKLNQLRAFNELMLVRSVSEAARNLGRTQPSVSGTIASLEADLGIQLFERRNGRLHPVPEAQYLHQECREILRRLDTVDQNIRRITELESGEIFIASMPGPSVFFMPDFISRHCGPQQDIRSTLTSRSSDAVYRLMAAQQFDLGIADYDPIMSADTTLIDTRAFKFKCVCAIASDDPLSSKERIGVQDIADRSLASLYDEHPTHIETTRVFSEAGVTPKIRFQTQYFIPLLTYVERGLGCAIVDPISAKSYQLYRDDNSNISFIPFEPNISFDIAILSPAHRPLSHLAKTITEQLTIELAELADESS